MKKMELIGDSKKAWGKFPGETSEQNTIKNKGKSRLRGVFSLSVLLKKKVEKGKGAKKAKKSQAKISNLTGAKHATPQEEHGGKKKGKRNSLVKSMDKTAFSPGGTRTFHNIRKNFKKEKTPKKSRRGRG